MVEVLEAKTTPMHAELQGMVYASLFGAVTAVGAYIVIPFPVVPITLQTLFVALAACLLGGALGALSQVVYVLLGVVGLPVFSAGKSGLGVLIGPTGGYLIGFIAGAYVTGRLMDLKKGTTLLWTAFSVASGFLCIYTFGVAQLSLVAELEFLKAVSIGVLPFLIGDCLKIILAAILVVKIRDHVRSRCFR